MPAYFPKDKSDVLRQALSKLAKTTPIQATSPGSIARSFMEVIANELGDLYAVLDFNMTQSVVSTASGRGLDLLGELYGINRKTVSSVVEADRRVGAFYFYLDTAYGSDITIPAGTTVFTDNDTYVGKQLAFETASETILIAGRTRAYVALRQKFNIAAFSANANSLVKHDFSGPVGVQVKCVNPKPVSTQISYESDSNYRVRITKSVRTSAGGTLDAIRFTALSVSGVRDATIRQLVYGAGSFEVIITSEDGIFPQGMLESVNEALNKVRPVGVRMYLKTPEPLSFDSDITVFTGNNATDETILAGRIQSSVSRYVNSLLPGQEFVYNELIHHIFQSLADDKTVRDVDVVSLKINGEEIPRKNYFPKQFEQIVPGTVNVSLNTSINRRAVNTPTI